MVCMITDISMAFIANSDVKPYLGIEASDTTKDALIDTLISQVQDVFEGYITAPIESQSVTEYYSPYSDEFLLRSLQASGITVYGIDQENIETQFNESYLVQIQNLYYIKTDYSDRFKVTYTSGFSTVPNDLKMAGVMTVAGAYKMIETDRIGISRKTESMGAGSDLTVYTYMYEDPIVVATLKRYRVPYE